MFTSYGNLFYITALTTLTYLIIAAFLLRDTRPKLQPKRLRLRDIAVVAADRPFLAFCLLMLFMIISYQQMYTLFTVYSSAYVGLSKFWIGVLYALSGLMVALFQYGVSSEANKYKMTSALAFSAALFAIGFFMLSLVEMVWSPASSTMQASLSPESMRGRYFGFNGLTGNIGWAVGPLFGGLAAS